MKDDIENGTRVKRIREKGKTIKQRGGSEGREMEGEGSRGGEGKGNIVKGGMGLGRGKRGRGMGKKWREVYRGRVE